MKTKTLNIQTVTALTILGLGTLIAPHAAQAQVISDSSTIEYEGGPTSKIDVSELFSNPQVWELWPKRIVCQWQFYPNALFTYTKSKEPTVVIVAFQSSRRSEFSLNAQAYRDTLKAKKEGNIAKGYVVLAICRAKSARLALRPDLTNVSVIPIRYCRDSQISCGVCANIPQSWPRLARRPFSGAPIRCR